MNKGNFVLLKNLIINYESYKEATVEFSIRQVYTSFNFVATTDHNSLRYHYK